MQCVEIDASPAHLLCKFVRRRGRKDWGGVGRTGDSRLTPSIPSCAWVPFVFVVAIIAEALSCVKGAPPVCRRLSAVVEGFSREPPPPALASERESSWAAFARDRAGGMACGSDWEGGVAGGWFWWREQEEEEEEEQEEEEQEQQEQEEQEQEEQERGGVE